MMAIGVMRRALELGLNVPGDLSVVGFDDNQIAQFATPSLTAVQMSHVEVANVAFKALLDAVEDQCSGSSLEVCAIQSNLVLRSSTNLGPGRLGEAAPCKRADSGLPPKKFHSESAEPVVKWP
jgi:LacI family transcriptional regulator, galactose operon repressor